VTGILIRMPYEDTQRSSPCDSRDKNGSDAAKGTPGVASKLPKLGEKHRADSQSLWQ
jgi:hypothetical protein